MEQRSRRQRRVDAGQCPNCGKEAAPYYLCPDCRAKNSLRSKLNGMAKHGVVRKGGRVNLSHWWEGDVSLENSGMITKPSPLWGEGKGKDDKRLRPKLGKIPVDVERELVGMLQRFDRPVSEEEIISAWGKMRVRRDRASAAGDIVALISAERRRERRSKKRRKEAGL